MITLLERPALPVDDVTRREFVFGGTVLGLLAAAGCGSGDTGGTPAGNTQGSGAFPVTVDHAYGSTEIPAAPTRIVTVGYTDHDVILALGVVPVGVRDWYGDYPLAAWPWAQDELGDARPTVLRGEELSIEAVAALEPDLIIGMYVNLDQNQYDLLSRIAPTIAQSGDHAPYSTPWQDMTRTAGRCLNRSERAESLIAEIEGLIAAARAEHPEFEGTELVYAGAYGEGQVYVESSRSVRLGLLEALGFVVPAEVDTLVAADLYSADISLERLDVLDHEVLFWELGATEGMRSIIEGNPLYQRLDVVVDGRAVFVDEPVLAGAMAHSTVLSLPYVLDKIVPMLSAASLRTG